MVGRPACHFSEEDVFFVFLLISEPISSKPEMRKIRSLIKAGKVFGKDGAPQMQRADREIATGSG